MHHDPLGSIRWRGSLPLDPDRQEERVSPADLTDAGPEYGGDGGAIGCGNSANAAGFVLLGCINNIKFGGESSSFN